MKLPPGVAVPPAGTVVALDVAAAQEGGSLMDTLIVPMLVLCIVGGFPPQPMMIKAITVIAKPNKK
jgi:hypothetical protein